MFFEGWQTRLKTEHSAFLAEQETKISAIKAREEAASKQMHELLQMSERWKEDRKQEFESVQKKSESFEKAAQEYFALCDERRQQLRTLEQDRRDLIKKERVVEQYRKECLTRAKDVEAAERRIERIERRWRLEEAVALRQSQVECRELETSVAHYQEKIREMQIELDKTAKEKQSLLTNKYEWEREKLSLESEAIQLRGRVQSLQQQREARERHVRELQDEIERIARALLDGNDPITGVWPGQSEDSGQATMRIDKAA